MALPDDFPKRGRTLARHGVMFMIAPDVTQEGWQESDVEIQQADDDAGSPGDPDVGTVETILRLPPIPQSGRVVTVERPNDGVRKHWRHRLLRPGRAAGAWSDFLETPVDSGVFGAIPSPLPQEFEALAVSQVVGQVSFDASRPPKVSGAAGDGVITKTVRIPFSEFVPGKNTYTWDATSGIYVVPNTINTLMLLYCAAVLPKGAIITGFSMRGYRETSSDVCVAILIRGSDATSTTLATCTHSTTGWATTSAAFTETVGDFLYSTQIELKGVLAIADARFGWIEITYTISDLSVGL